jgi:predicted secreted protein
MQRLLLFALALASSCLAQQAAQQSTQQPAAPAVAAPAPPALPAIPTDGTAQVVSETYLGMLACPDCGGIRAEITLYWEGRDGRTPIAYHMTETKVDVADAKPQENAGFFSEQSAPDSAQLPGGATNGTTGGTLVELRTGQPPLKYFLRVAGNNGELLLLNEKLRVLPDRVPHALGRVSGEQQHGLTVLTDRDDGRTVTLKGGEVFIVLLPIHADGYRWNSDQPAEMTLLQPDEQPPPSQAVNTNKAPYPGAAAPKTMVPAEVAVVTSTYHAHHMATGAPSYQAWQMVAPAAGSSLVEQVLSFQLRHATDEPGLLPGRMVTFRIDVP